MLLTSDLSAPHQVLEESQVSLAGSLDSLTSKLRLQTSLTLFYEEKKGAGLQQEEEAAASFLTASVSAWMLHAGPPFCSHSHNRKELKGTEGFVSPQLTGRLTSVNLRPPCRC